MGLRVDWCGLRPARKRSNGGLGVLEDNPQLSNGIYVRGGIIRVSGARLLYIMGLSDDSRIITCYVK
jgi:hypothetical protein